MTMKTRILGLAVGLAIAAFLLGAGQDSKEAQPEGKSQAQSPHQLTIPKADPEDVNSIDAIVDALYDVESGDPGTARDWERLRSLYHPLARLVAARPTGPSGDEIVILSVDEYLKAEQSYLENAGFHARDVKRKIERFGNIAHVLSTYEYRRKADDPEPYVRGVNSIQLVRNSNRWWIVTLYWDFERPDNPIPEDMLPDKSDG